MKTINIHGKKYVEVNERIKYFRENYKGWSLTSDFIELTEQRCVIKATVLNEEGRIIGDGIAEETKGSTYINKTSFVENCQTSAWGRALGSIGIGIDSSIASADEVKMAIAQKETKPTKITNKQFEAMKSSIADGKQEVVKSRMKKYIFTKEQELEINNLLSGKTKITSVSEILEDLGDKMLEYNDLK
tara:strand:- start:73 stop:636 length:564 start_codon:yes stop_codon:yes gene_type:complete